MKLYKVADAPAGERWHSAKTGLKDFEEVELPKGGRQPMAELFNANEREVSLGAFADGARLDEDVRALDPLEASELRAVAAASGTTVPQPPAPPSMTLPAVEEFIQNSNPAQLASIASNVCWRIKELAGAQG